MSVRNLLNVETNLVGTIVNTAVTTTATTIYAQFIDSKTGAARTPSSTTNCFVIDKDTENFEIIEASSHSTTGGVTTITVLATYGRNLPLYGTGAGSAIGKGHALGAEIGCVDIHSPTAILNAIMAGTNGTNAGNFRIGDETAGQIKIYAQNDAANKPYLLYDTTTAAWYYANDGLSENPFGGSGALTSGDGIDITLGVVSLDLKTDYGLHIDTAELSLEIKADSGLTADADGLQVQLAATSGLQFNTGLEVKLKTNGGVYKDSNGLYSQAPSLESTAYTYGEAITKDDCLYMLETDNRVYKITSSPETWKRIVGIAMEDGIAGDNKRVLIKGLVDGSFSAIQPTFSASGGAANFTVGNTTADKMRAFRINNTAGPEALLNGEFSVRLKKNGTPAGALYVGLCLGTNALPYVSHLSAVNRPCGMILDEQTIAEVQVGNVYDDEVVTFTNIKVPANSYIWCYFFVNAAVSAVNYYTIEGAATAGGMVLSTAAGIAVWSASNFLPNHSFTVESVNPWEKHYAVRAYNGTDGGWGIGDNVATLPWNRVIGHVVSATQWYFNPTNNNVDSGYFTDSETSAGNAWFDTRETTNFRPSWIDFNIGVLEATVAGKTYNGACNYISNAVLSNSVQGAGISVTAAGVPTAVGGSAFPAGTTASAYYVVPFEDGFYFSNIQLNTGAGTSPWASGNALTHVSSYVASQK